MNIHTRHLAGLALASLLLSGCASTVWDEVNLMPAPDVYADGRLDPLPDREPMELVPYGGILYATDRRPASEDDNEKYYVDELLDGEIFYALKEARILVEQWRVHYNTIRPHSSLGYRPPAPQAINPLVMPALAPQQ